MSQRGKLDAKRLQQLDKQEVLHAAQTGQRFLMDKTIPFKVKAGAGVMFVLATFIYLWTPFAPYELIPDAIPVVGTADDSVGFVAITVFAAIKWARERGLKLAYNKAMAVMAEREAPRSGGRPPVVTIQADMPNYRESDSR